jgi:transposase
MVAGPLTSQRSEALLAMARGALKLKRDDLEAALDGDLSKRHLFLLERIHRHVLVLEAELAAVDAYLLDAMIPYQWAHRLLQTIPGIDQIASALILTEIGADMAQFGSATRLAAWAALCPGNNESAGKRVSAKTRKGNATIRYLLCECAHAACKTKSSLAAKYRSLRTRTGHKKSIVAIAHKMIRLIYILLSRDTAYRDPNIDYAKISTDRNAPRWIQQLKKIGRWPASRPAAAS